MTTAADMMLDRIFQSQELPTLPVVASKLLTLTSKEETTLTDIANLISRDVALSTKVLRVSNSSFYSFPQQIATINQAVSILGTNAVRSLILSFSFLSLHTKKSSPRFDFNQFWRQSLVCATAAKLILEQCGEASAEEIFIAGLLNNIGKLIFATALPEEYDKVLAAMENTPDREERSIQEEILGISEAEAGYAVAQRWGLPEILLVPIKFSHAPEEFHQDSPLLAQYVRAVHLAQLIVNIYYSAKPEFYHQRFREEAERLLALSQDAVNSILQQIDQKIDQAAEFFNIKIGNVKSVAEILQEANLRLSLLNLSYEEMNRELIKTKIELEKLADELAQKNALLENLANIDGLTEIHNHRYFHTFLDSEINRSIRNESTISLLLADIDLFKQFNDTYGHQVGDFILKEFCRVTQEIIREYDLIARYGGEEFVFVLPETEAEEAMLVAEKIRKTVDDYTFDDSQQTYHLTISIGVATAAPESRDFSKNSFINNADKALYEAKANGRNRAVLFSEKKKKWYKL